MKRGEIAWGLLMIVCIGLLIGFAAMLASQQTSNHKAPLSAENPEPEGIKALYRFYEVRGYKVGLWKRDYQQLPNSSGDLLMIVGPQAEVPNEQDYQALMNWIRKGNKVILWAPSESDWTERFQFQGMSCPQSMKRRVFSIESSVWFQRTKQINWPSGQCVLPTIEHEDVLVDHQSYTLMIKKKMGKGEIYYTPETEILMNHQIDQEDHMQLLLAIAERSSNMIWFDESVHPWPPRLQSNFQTNQSTHSSDESSVDPPPTVFDLLNRDGWLILIQILLLVFLFFYMKGKRFASPRNEWKQKKRNSFEYVEALARWYHRSNLRKEVFDEFRKRLREELKQMFRIPNDQSEQSVLEKVDRYLGKDFLMRYKKWVVSPDQEMIKHKRMPASFFLQSMIEIQKMRRELYEWKHQKRVK